MLILEESFDLNIMCTKLQNKKTEAPSFKLLFNYFSFSVKTFRKIVLLRHQETNPWEVKKKKIKN
jgi:hypothetical protein